LKDGIDSDLNELESEFDNVIKDGIADDKNIDMNRITVIKDKVKDKLIEKN